MHAKRMRMTAVMVIGIGLVTAGLAVAQYGPGRGTDGAQERPQRQQREPGQREAGQRWGAKIDRAVARMIPASGSAVKGVVTFERVRGARVKIVAEVEGLTPNGTHAIHVHEYGDITADDGTSAGSHYNPEGHEHGLPSSGPRHAGDLGNLQADANGRARYELTVDNITIAGGRNPVIGRSVIIHEKADDGGQPTGNAGGRISMGVIGVAKSTAE